MEHVQLIYLTEIYLVFGGRTNDPSSYCLAFFNNLKKRHKNIYYVLQNKWKNMGVGKENLITVTIYWEISILLGIAKCFACVISFNITKSPIKRYHIITIVITITITFLLIKKWSCREAGNSPGATQLEGSRAQIWEQFCLTPILWCSWLVQWSII